jgi:SAM-dependent methyltransferase
MRRGRARSLRDFITFPLRAVLLFEEDRFGLSSLRTERFDYVSREVAGYCLDIGCGRHNLFIRHHLAGHGKGIDVFAYAGLGPENIVPDMTQLPFSDGSFDSVTFIANLNHVPRSLRDAELAEAWRCLRPGGNVIVTMGNALAEVLVHKVVALYDRLFGTHHDVDSERGMHEEEEYYVRDSEIVARLQSAGFSGIIRKRFATQWGLNHLFVGWKGPGLGR